VNEHIVRAAVAFTPNLLLTAQNVMVDRRII
jgi:hypothetical protein